jgi:hypothetical protein
MVVPEIIAALAAIVIADVLVVLDVPTRVRSGF